MRIVVTAAAVAAALAVSPLHAQQGMQDVEIRSEHVGGNIHALFGQGGNIGVLTGPDGVVLIDDQFAPLTDKIRAAVTKLDGGPIRFVLNTHWHFDHTGGNENMAQAGAIIVAHDNVRERLSTEQFMAFFDRRVPASPEAALPVVTFTEEVAFHLNEETRVIHVPHAHTDGDSIVHFTESNVIHMGDLLFAGRFPFIDLGSGGSVQGLIEGVKKGLDMADEETVFIPGHGPLSSPSDVQAYLDMLTTARDRVAALIAEGKSLSETIAAEPMAEYNEAWGSGFIKPDQFVTFVYNSLSQERAKQ